MRIILLVLLLHFSYQGYLSYTNDYNYCSVVNWSLPGFKLGCILRGN